MAGRPGHPSLLSADPLVSEHARLMESAGYWQQFEIKVVFEKPLEIVGVIEALRETRAKASDPWTPRLAIRQDDGVLVIVDAYPTRLAAELVLAKPYIGDRVRIRYLGEEEKSAPGMSPAKRFTVDVKRANGSQPPGRPPGEASGEVPGENDPGAGT